jgi:hypothetical protein
LEYKTGNPGERPQVREALKIRLKTVLVKGADYFEGKKYMIQARTSAIKTREPKNFRKYLRCSRGFDLVTSEITVEVIRANKTMKRK